MEWINCGILYSNEIELSTTTSYAAKMYYMIYLDRYKTRQH